MCHCLFHSNPVHIDIHISISQHSERLTSCYKLCYTSAVMNHCTVQKNNDIQHSKNMESFSIFPTYQSLHLNAHCSVLTYHIMCHCPYEYISLGNCPALRAIQEDG